MVKRNGDYPPDITEIKKEHERQYPRDFWKTLEQSWWEESVQNCFSDIEDSQICLEIFHKIWDKVDDEIAKTEQGQPIYRGLRIDDYRSFVNGLSHRGFTLDQYLGKKPLRHRNTGVSWTYDENCARETGDCNTRPDDRLVILKGINPSQIDVEGTLIVNMSFEGREKEIRLRDDSQITLLKICRFVEQDQGKFKKVCEPYNKKIVV